MRKAPSLALRAFVAIALTIVFYLFALGIAVTLLLIAYFNATSGGADFRLVALGIIGGGAILWGIFPRIDRLKPPGPKLLPGDAPEFFAELQSLSNATGQAMPSDVYLIDEVNAWVTNRGGLLGLGGRQVMAVGLPVIAVLTRSELRAVLAHEFGHYFSGDTRLGPTIYKTRIAMSRTVKTLAKVQISYISLLAYPFLWYGKLFLRITQAISRAQELSADALAARIAGPTAIGEGLKKIEAAAAVFSRFVSANLTPAVSAGYRPSIVEGFSYFMRVPELSGRLDAMIAHTSSQKEIRNAYDSHPPLGLRLQEIAGLSSSVAVDNSPAMSMFPSLSVLDDAMYRFLLEDADKLKPLPWQKIGEAVYVPIWQSMILTDGGPLFGLTPAGFPEFVRQRSLRTGAVPDGYAANQKTVISLPENERNVFSAAAMMLSLLLLRSGWQLHAMPGECYLERDGRTLEPFTLVSMLTTGTMTIDEWQRTWTDAGVVNEPLQLQVAAGVTN